MRTAIDRRAFMAALSAVIAAAALVSACSVSPAGPEPATMPAAAAVTGAVAGRATASASAAASTLSAPAPGGAPASAPSSTVKDGAAALNGVDATTIESAARAFFVYFDRVRQMSPGELGREFVRLDQPGNPGAVLELALALGQTRNPSDTVRALGVLDPLLKSTDPQNAPWRPLARLLAVRYNEQRRLEDQVERQSQQLREAQRRQEQLTQQLEALKAIERSLNNRPAAPAPGANNRPPPP